MQRQLYAVYDNKAEEIVGGVLYAFAHDAVAVRMFTDAYRAENTMINRHPEDYDLIGVGTIEGKKIEGDIRVVLSGSALAASQQTEER